MKHYSLASALVVFSLLGASQALAHSRISGESTNTAGFHLGSLPHLASNKDDRDEGGKRADRITLAGSVSSISGSTIILNGTDGTIYTVDAATTTISSKDERISLRDIAVGDMLVVKGTFSGPVITALKIRDISFAKRAFLGAIGVADAGIVTSVNGPAFTLRSFGAHGTTTVFTTASTTYKVNGSATTSSALTVGSRAIVFGTTGANGITASLVSILNIGSGFFKHFFR